jgi:hypothetical protein
MSTSGIVYQVRPYGDETTEMHSWTITENGAVISDLYADLGTGMIANIWTSADHRDEGLATRLYREASRTVRLFHSPEWARTDDGSRFAERVGGAVISDDDAHAFYGDE